MSSALVPRPQQDLDDPGSMIDGIEDKLPDAADLYWHRIDRLMVERLNSRHGDPDWNEDALILREMTAGLALENAARYVGFILGFEHAVRLLTTATPSQGA